MNHRVFKDSMFFLGALITMLTMNTGIYAINAALATATAAARTATPPGTPRPVFPSVLEPGHPWSAGRAWPPV